MIHVNMAGYRNAPDPVPPVCPECATTPHTDPAAPHIHVTDFGYVLYTPTRESRTWIEEIRAEGVAAGRKQAAAAIREHAEVTGWYEGGGVWADAIEIAEGAEWAARIAEGGEPNAG